MDFEEYLHPEFLKLIEKIHLQGFKTGIVGGTCRDFYLGKPNKHDYDCELRPLDLNGNLLEAFEKLKFSEDYKIERLPYNIIKLTHNGFTVELTLPRKEKFNENFSHSNFQAEFSAYIDNSEAALRRDFTINSIIYEFNGGWQLIDPLEGVQDLKLKKLKPCGVDFQKDPVRFLRAVRFKILYGFDVDSDILQWAKHINIEDFSSHYLRQEATKSKKPLVFILELFGLLGLQYETNFEDFLREDEYIYGKLKDHLNSLCFLEKELIEYAIEVFDFSLKPVHLEKPIKFRNIQQLDLDEFIQLELDSNLVKTFKYFSNLDSPYIEILVKLGLIDIDKKIIDRIIKATVDVEDIEFNMRSVVSLFRKIKSVNFDK